MYLPSGAHGEVDDSESGGATKQDRWTKGSDLETRDRWYRSSKEK